jgi:hypothetical protein
MRRESSPRHWVTGWALSSALDRLEPRELLGISPFEMPTVSSGRQLVPKYSEEHYSHEN